MNKTRRVLVVLAVVALGLITPTSSQAAPNVLNGITDSKQVILVTAKSWNSTSGTVQVFEKKNKVWSLTQKAVKTNLGYGGLVPGSKRKQGTGKTPTGTYAITWAFGIKDDPGTKLKYTKVDKNDAWTYNPRFPSTYNVFQTVNKSWSGYGNYVERLASYKKQYNYVAVMDFNLPKGKITQGVNGVNRTDAPANTSRGGGIFLHVSNGTKTAGCIAVPEKYMKKILNWLDPKKNPVIVIQVKK
ncbi:MAG: L,D-transpeptidase family protein [Actinomycetia bacterium]|nr:L,D-transpeptidase family protein [Actinomycetes bacterium]